MKVSIIISNYNYAQFVGSAIESCLAQTVPCDIIVVDDASTDRSWEVIKSYRGKVIGVRLKENSGGNARGKNVGICMTGTEFVTCFDSDDLMTPRSIEKRLQPINGRKTFSFGMLKKIKQDCLFDIADVDEEPLSKIIQRKVNRAANKRCSHLSVIGGTTVLAHKHLYDLYGLYDEDLKWKIDKEMWNRWLSRGVVPEMVLSYVAIYRRHSESATYLASIGDFSKKDIKQVNQVFFEKVRLRDKVISEENTQFPRTYDFAQFISEVI